MKNKETRIVLWIAIAILCALSVGFYLFYKHEQKIQTNILNDQKYALTQIINERDSLINEWVITSNQIEKDIQIIKEKENYINLKTSGGELSKDEKTRLLEDMKYISTLIDANKQKIFTLNKKLKESGTTIAGLQDKISILDSILTQDKLDISALKADVMTKDIQIKQLDSTVDDMKITIEQKNMTINTQTNELNKAFVTTGTFKELKEKGLVSKTGGFVGLGKIKTINKDSKNSLFTQVDVSTIKSIPFDAKSVNLITDHPSNSYKVIYVAERQKGFKPRVTRIDIIDPQEFWKISKYAIVEIKK
jgi:hypothetical protein